MRFLIPFIIYYIIMSNFDVKQLRNRMGLTQEQFANHIGSATRTVSKWEEGAPISRSRLVYLKRLAEAVDRGETVVASTRRRAKNESDDTVNRLEITLERTLGALENAQKALATSQQHVTQLIEALTRTLPKNIDR